MARLTFPSRLELNRPEGSFNAAPLGNVILTTFLYVSPVQTMPPWDQTGVPGDVGLTHFHSSTISGSASRMISRTFASVFPRQSPSSLIFSSINAEADSTGTGLFMSSSKSRTYFSCTQRNLQPLQSRNPAKRGCVRAPRTGSGAVFATTRPPAKELWRSSQRGQLENANERRDTSSGCRTAPLKDESLEDSAKLPDPDLIAGEIAEDLEAVLDQFSQIAADWKK